MSEGSKRQPDGASFRGPKNRTAVYEYSLAHPFMVSLLLFAIAIFLRYLDIFVTGLAEAWGEAFLHKALGFLLVVGYLWLVRKPLTAIGFQGRALGKALLIGGVGPVLVYVVSFGVQLYVSSSAGQEPSLVFSPTDPKTGLTGAWGFAVLLFVGNIVNSFMEEGLFRGVMLSLTRARTGFWLANLFQASLFSVWHIAWPLRDLQTGRIDFGGFVGDSALIMAGTLVSGLVYGYMYLKTGSLWTPWLAHLINNSVLNVLHIQTLAGLDADIGVLYIAMSLGTMALIPWTKVLAERGEMSPAKGWTAT